MKLYSITLNGRHLFTDLGVDGKILKWILDKLGGCDCEMDSADFGCLFNASMLRVHHRAQLNNVHVN